MISFFINKQLTAQSESNKNTLLQIWKNSLKILLSARERLS